MTSKLTREERVQALYDLKVGQVLSLADIENVKMLSRMALAAMDSEPVAIIDQANLDYLRSGADADVWPPEREEMGDVLLYRHPQPAPVVMDDTKLRELFDSWFASDCSFDLSPEASEADNIAWRESYWYVWKRCRATILAAARQSPGSEPATVPDKWIPVSEQMPEDAQWCVVITEYGYYVQCWSDGYGWLGDDISIPNIDVTHWMPLPAGPQGVKGE